jgi:hypothetical protein
MHGIYVFLRFLVSKFCCLVCSFSKFEEFLL